MATYQGMRQDTADIYYRYKIASSNPRNFKMIHTLLYISAIYMQQVFTYLCKGNNVSRPAVQASNKVLSCPPGLPMEEYIYG